GVERGVAHLGAEADARAQPVFVGAVAQIGEDLGLRREAARPVVLGLERERVEVRRNVAGRARVAVLAPAAADLVGFFEDDEVVDARAPERDGHAEPAEAGPDDRHVAGAIAHPSPSMRRLTRAMRQKFSQRLLAFYAVRYRQVL